MSAPRPAWQASLELALIVAAGLLATAVARDVLLASLAPASAASGVFWVLPAGLLLGMVFADFTSGTLHWFCDRFFAADTPLVGRTLIAPFREHHDDPLGITRHGLLELHGNSCIPLIPVLLFARALTPGESALGAGVSTSGLLAQSALLFFALSAMATNQCHKWAHEPAPGGTVRWMQRWGLVLSPEMHARHHRGEFQQSYCMTTGWLNPLLDHLNFFPRLERGVRVLDRRAR